MGYAGSSDGQLLFQSNSNTNNNLCTVIRDCLHASVECKILSEIHKAVSQMFPTTLQEVLDFRQTHIGSAEDCIREMIKQRQSIQSA